MYTLSNPHLSVSILDPVADAARLGSRYCIGGYIWQIDDNRCGPLLAGRSFPESPSPFDGQGAPEAFVTPLGSDDCAVGERVTVIGVGEVKRTSTSAPFHVRDNPEVELFCEWGIERQQEIIRMSTDQRASGYEIFLIRSVALDNRIVVSRTEIFNRSSAALPLRWFAHPFFPLNPDRKCCRMAFPVTVPENPGYTQSADGILCMQEEYDWKKGHFLQLGIAGGEQFEAEVFHPKLSSIKVTTDFPLESLPIWANDRTFSLEPYLSATIAPGDDLKWHIEYRID